MRRCRFPQHTPLIGGELHPWRVLGLTHQSVRYPIGGAPIVRGKNAAMEEVGTDARGPADKEPGEKGETIRLVCNFCSVVYNILSSDEPSCFVL